MLNFLHTNIPERILFSFGPLHIYWYGFLIVIGMILAILVAIKLASYYEIQKDLIVDTAFWLIVGGVAGARIYHIILEFPYYYENPLNIFKLWQGGLAIHGAIIAGLIITYLIAKKNKLSLWKFISIFTPGVPLAMSIGRWGNYFNQENFGLPTSLPWSIPIEIQNRVPGYFNFEYFHPTFLYESIGDFAIFLFLILIHVWIIKKRKKEKTPDASYEMRDTRYEILVIGYLILYSILRFSMEFIRIDTTPEFLGLRWPQIMSLIIVIISVILLIALMALKKNKNHANINSRFSSPPNP